MRLSSTAIEAVLQRLGVARRVVEVRPLKPDTGKGAGAKATGYGQPIRVVAEDEAGTRKSFVLHTASANEFGHDRRADRADELLLSFDTYPLIPGHVAPLDVGFIVDGVLESGGGKGEPYLLTTWADGRPYAEDLRRIGQRGLEELDFQRCRALAASLVGLHRHKLDEVKTYRRAIRDLLGHGEGIFGIIDGYPGDTPAAPPDRLRAIEQKCLEWRWWLRERDARLSRIHGDFHPFNILFGEASDPALVDASRGCVGDPADDVAALTINYVFFAADQPAGWPQFSRLWHTFWHSYLEGSKDDGLLEVIAPFLAWRGLVVANPKFYPELSAAGRSRILGLVERVLSAPRLELA